MVQAEEARHFSQKSPRTSGFALCTHKMILPFPNILACAFVGLLDRTYLQSTEVKELEENTMIGHGSEMREWRTLLEI